MCGKKRKQRAEREREREESERERAGEQRQSERINGVMASSVKVPSPHEVVIREFIIYIIIARGSN